MSSFILAIVLLLVVLFWSFTRASGFALLKRKRPNLCADVARIQKRYCGPPGTKTSFAKFVKDAVKKT